MALALARLGVDHIVVTRYETLAAEPRAHITNQRTMEVFRDLGVEGPYPDGSGFHDFIPTAIDRAESLRIIDAIPPAVVRHYAFCGTPAEVIA